MQKTSPLLDKLLPALFAVQGALGKAPKVATNPFYNSKYATLEAVWDTAIKPLQDNGFVVVQTITTLETGSSGLSTTLFHQPSGQWLSDTMPLLMQQATPQGQGSAVTYARRYSLSAMLGIQTGDDDDGNAASHNNAAAAAVDWVKLKNFAAAQGWTDQQIKDWIKSERHKGVSDGEVFKAGMSRFAAAAAGSKN